MSVASHQRLIKTYEGKNNKDLVFIKLGGGVQSVALRMVAFLDEAHCGTVVATPGVLSPGHLVSSGMREWPAVAREKVAT